MSNFQGLYYVSKFQALFSKIRALLEHLFAMFLALFGEFSSAQSQHTYPQQGYLPGYFRSLLSMANWG